MDKIIEYSNIWIRQLFNWNKKSNRSTISRNPLNKHFQRRIRSFVIWNRQLIIFITVGVKDGIALIQIIQIQKTCPFKVWDRTSLNKQNNTNKPYKGNHILSPPHHVNGKNRTWKTYLNPLPKNQSYSLRNILLPKMTQN